jgi:hypothetical protein
MSIFGKGKTSDKKYDDLISAEMRSIKRSERLMSSMEKRLQKDKRADKKRSVVGFIHKIASKPISQQDGMEAMFGVKKFRKTNHPNDVRKFTGFGR